MFGPNFAPHCSFTSPTRSKFSKSRWFPSLAHNAGTKPVRARAVEDYLRSVGQDFTSVGGLDPRHRVGTTMTDFWLYR
jgi:hypothetical protein